MGKPTGFLDYARMDCPARSAEARVADWAPLDLPLSEKNRRRQSGRCMDCGVPFCQAGVTFDGALLGCPLHNLIPEWNDLLWNGNYEGALQRLLKTSPFPEFTARVCPALCEKACVCGRVSQPVTVRENELAIIEYAFENDLMQPMPPAARSDKRIAVVGSGPAGLSAAYYLNRRGHHVTVFERDPLPGGLLTYGIPEMKLPKRIVARRISLLEQEGVVFRTNCCVGRDLRPEALAAEFDLAIFCCGADGAVSAVTLRESGEQLPCDLLLLASGFSGCEAASLGAYEAVRQAGIPVLTAGDMASGASLVVLAIASGKQAAARAYASLMGYTNIL